MALTYRPGTRVLDPGVLAMFTTALKPTGLPQPFAASRTTSIPPRSSPLAGLITLAIIVATIALPVAVATANTPDESCAPIPYALDADLGPPGAAQTVIEVLNEIQAMSGVRFVPARDQQLADAPVRIAWAEHAADLESNRRQLGRASAIWSHGDGDATIVSAEVLLRHPVDAEHIHRAPVDWETLVRHEVGHLMGLRHQADPSDVMNPRLTNEPQTWTSTDRAHLRARGRAAGCDEPSIVR